MLSDVLSGAGMTIDEWLALGVELGFCSPVVCDTHDSLPGTPDELEEWEKGWDPCIPAVRIWSN